MHKHTASFPLWISVIHPWLDLHWLSYLWYDMSIHAKNLVPRSFRLTMIQKCFLRYLPLDKIISRRGSLLQKMPINLFYKLIYGNITKNIANGDLILYMCTHNIPMHLPNKCHVNQPKYKGYRMSCCCSLLRVNECLAILPKYVSNSYLILYIVPLGHNIHTYQMSCQSVISSGRSSLFPGISH